MSASTRFLSLEKSLLRMETAFKRALARHDRKQEDEVELWLNRRDKLRLLNLQIWSLRYKVPIEYILRVLLDKLFVKHRKQRGRSIGVRITSLTGQKAERFLRDKVCEDFPSGEPLMEWRAAEQQRLGGYKEIRMQNTDPVEYQRQIDAWRRQQLLTASMYRKPWRDNPWR